MKQDAKTQDTNFPRAIRKLGRVMPLVLAAVLLTGMSVVVNPYANVDWDRVEQHKANLHTHTTQSDGRIPPHEVVDEYKARGYSILAVTDHNLCTWPWTEFASLERKGRAFLGDRAKEKNAEEEDAAKKEARESKAPEVPAYENRDPEALGMLAVPGNEPSRHHHMGTYFIDYETRSNDLEQTLAEVGEAGGLAMLFHPERYWSKDADGEITPEIVDRYITLFRDYDHLFGMEIINQGQRYKNDIALWDHVLAESMPALPVWGYANDDMHGISALGRDSNMFLLTALTEEELRAAMLTGRSYIRSVSTHERADRDMAQTPIVQTIRHDEEAGTITITAESGGKPLPEDRYNWISDGEAVHTGPTLDYKNTGGLGSYVRAEMRGDGGTAFTNPFGLAR